MERVQNSLISVPPKKNKIYSHNVLFAHIYIQSSAAGAFNRLSVLRHVSI